MSCTSASKGNPDIRDAFHLFAVDRLKSSDLDQVLRCLGIKAADRETIREKIQQETGEDKPIDWNTFEAIVGSFMENSGPREDELLEAFKVFDREGNGTISAAELKHLVAGASSDDEMEANIEKMIQDQFVDGDGQVNYIEFMQVINKMAATKQWTAEIQKL
ncbi:squidulin-like [Oscarella lobularis]|uniref:squidulin-like n=1 Tax=Oscarella lobularis TaxID=121494 RepID=UPI0033144D42